MSCKRFEEEISAYIDGELSREREKFVRDHLSSCSDCQALFHKMTELKKKVGQVARAELPEEELYEIKRAIVRERKSWYRLAEAVAVLVGMLAITVLFAVKLLPEMRTFTGAEKALESVRETPEARKAPSEEKTDILKESPKDGISTYGLLSESEIPEREVFEKLLKGDAPGEILSFAYLPLTELRVELLLKTRSERGDIYWLKLTGKGKSFLLVVDESGKVLFEKEINP